MRSCTLQMRRGCRLQGGSCQEECPPGAVLDQSNGSKSLGWAHIMLWPKQVHESLAARPTEDLLVMRWLCGKLQGFSRNKCSPGMWLSTITKILKGILVVMQSSVKHLLFTYLAANVCTDACRQIIPTWRTARPSAACMVAPSISTGHRAER